MIRIALLVVAALPSLFSSAPSVAGERMVPALTCADPGGATSSFQLRLENQSIFNTATVVCPLERTNTTARPIRIEVTVKDQNGGSDPSDNIACRVGVHNTLGVAQAFGAIRRTSGIDGASGRVLNLAVPVNRPGFYAVICTLPRLVPTKLPSQFGAIRIVEAD